MKTYKKLNIFVSSPGDVKPERKIVKEVTSRINSSNYSGDYLLVPFCYEDMVPPVVAKPAQLVVDEYMLRAQDADIFICIFWCRFGTPFVDESTGKEYQSGTHYEFLQAYQSTIESKKPVILLYRCVRPMSHDVDLQQVTSVRTFFKDFSGSDNKFSGLYKTYESEKDFDALVFSDLLAILNHDFPSSGLATPDQIALAPNPNVQPPASTPTLSKIRECFSQANVELQSYPALIGGVYSIQREEVNQMIQWLELESTGSKPKLGMLIDKPGSGKTVAMAQVLQRLETKKIAVLAIKSDYLSGIKSVTELQQRLNLPASIGECVRKLAEAEPVIILIDQIDALSVALSQDFAALDLIYSLLLTLINIENVQVIVSCREFDLNFDPRLSTLSQKEYQKFVLSPLTEDQIKAALKSANLNTNFMTAKLFQLLSVPLHLSLYVDIATQSNTSAIPQELHSLQQLYDQLWERRIASSAVPKLIEAINLLVEEMQSQRQLTAPIGVLDKDEYRLAVNHLQSINFIRKEKGNFVFFHQTFFDYCYARRFVATKKLLSQTILGSDQGLFERSQMIQVLGYLRISNFSKYIPEIGKLFFSISPKLTVHLRILLIEWFATLPDPSEEEHIIAKRLLQDPQDQTFFLDAAKGNKGWFDRLNDGFIASLLHNGDAQKVGQVTINYLASLISHKTEEVLSLLEPYKGRSTAWDNLLLHCLRYLEQWNE